MGPVSKIVVEGWWGNGWWRHLLKVKNPHRRSGHRRHEIMPWRGLHPTPPFHREKTTGSIRWKPAYTGGSARSSDPAAGRSAPGRPSGIAPVIVAAGSSARSARPRCRFRWSSIAVAGSVAPARSETMKSPDA